METSCDLSYRYVRKKISRVPSYDDMDSALGNEESTVKSSNVLRHAKSNLLPALPLIVKLSLQEAMDDDGFWVR